MFCSVCGIALVNIAKFCARCGAPVSQGQPEPQPRPSITSPINPNPTDQPGFTNPQGFNAPAYTVGPAAGIAPYPACAYHTFVQAAGACAGCGYYFCRACICNYAGRNYCGNCWARCNPAAQQAYNQQPYSYGYGQPYVYRPAPQVKSPGLALFLSLLMPGVGQFYNGDIGKGILLFIAFWLLVWVFIGWIFWVVAMIDAYQSAQNINLSNQF